MIRTYFLNAQKLPMVIESNQKDRGLQMLNDLIRLNKDFFQLQLLQYGALLFRGFQIQTADEFSSFVEKFSGRDFFNYAGGASPRREVKKDIYNSTEYPPQLSLDLHNELSYSKTYPQHLYFFCLTAPERGGETTLGNSRRILRALRPKIVGLFKYKKVLYERNLRADKGSGYSWQEVFETDDKQEVKEICRRTGTDYEWNINDSLCLRQICPATLFHPETAEEVWFNQALGFHTSTLDEETLSALHAAKEKPRLNSFFGDGSPICRLMLEHIRGVLGKETILHKWQEGDILILDNILTAHGRMPFSGARKIILAMTR